MNRIRKQQGLKPLYAPQKQQQQQATKKSDVDVKKEKEDEIKKEDEAKTNKEDDEIMPSLGEILMKEEGESSDLNAWIAKSRAAEKQQRLDRIINRAHKNVSSQSTQEASQEYGEEDLQGLKVAHDLNTALGDGEEMVLTLADAPILKDGKLNEDEDVLENTELREQERWEKARAVAQSATYDKYGDWEFEELRKGKIVPHGVSAVGSKQSILPQYDGVDSLSGDVDIDSHRTLYTIGNTCPKSKTDIMNRLKAFDNNNLIINNNKNLNNHNKDDNNESEDTNSLFKKGGIKKDRKKISAQRKMQLSIEALIDEINEDKANSRSEIDQKNEHGSRAARKASNPKKKEAEDMVREMEIRQRNYERVVERSRKSAITGSDDIVDEEENNFYRTLSAATAAKAKASSAKMSMIVAAGKDGRSERNAMDKEFASRVRKRGDTAEMDWSKKYGNGVVVSQVTEFVRNVKNEEDASATPIIPFAEDVKKEVDDSENNNSILQSQIDINNEDKKDNINNEDKNNNSEEIITNSIFGSEEPLYSEGLGATLKLLQQKGGIEKVEREMEYQIGRSKDGEFQRNEKDDHILLEYTDEDGNPLKPKEAFRQLSHKFHGRNPNKKKMAKIQKKLQEERAKVNMPSTDTPLHSTEALKKMTERLHQPYMVLSGSK